jgi:hypothetical protein
MLEEGNIKKPQPLKYVQKFMMNSEPYKKNEIEGHNNGIQLVL